MLFKADTGSTRDQDVQRTFRPGREDGRINVKALKLIDNNIKSDWNWAYLYLIVKVSWKTEHFTRWHEVCSCHSAKFFTCEQSYFRRNKSTRLSGVTDDRATPTGCIMAGRRAPHLACGCVAEVVERICNFNQDFCCSLFFIFIQIY